MSDKEQRMGTVKRTSADSRSESDESLPALMFIVIDFLLLLRMTSSASSMSELLLLTPLLLPPELLCGWIEVSLSDSNPSSLLRFFCIRIPVNGTDVEDDVVEDAQDEAEEMDEVDGKMRNPRSLNFNFIHPISGILLLVVDESDKVITSFLTLAKNCEAH
jgi:hypothetical protein